MFSAAEEWRDGKRIWRVEHEGDSDTLDVEATGQLPDNFDDLKRRALVTQEAEGGRDADVDHVFDVAIALAASIVGYRHDASPPIEFELVDRSEAESISSTLSTRPWWRFW